MTAELHQVAEQYRLERDTMTEKEKAVRERALWAMASPEIRKETLRRDFLKKMVNEGTNTTEARSSILGIGDASDPIWDRIQKKKMPYNTGGQVARRAKKYIAEEDMDAVAAVTRALKEYDALPFLRTTEDGIPYRFGPTNGGYSTRSEKTEKPAPPPPAPETQFHQVDPGKDREFWLNFRSTLADYMERRTEGLDPSTRSILKQQFETDVKVVIDQFLANIYREQKKQRNQTSIMATAVTRQKLLDACEALHMDPPQTGAKIDMALATRQKKLLARAYHPDSNGGDTTTQDKYIAVIEAFQTLEAYAEQSNGK